jgi:hypothetical protein
MSRVALAVLLLAACGGDDEGGGSGDAGGGADGAPEVDGGGDPAPPPADGQFTVLESAFGEGDGSGAIAGSILDGWPAFHHLAMDSGACKLWVYEPVDCSPCNGICDSDGTCVPYPTSLSAGTVTVSTTGGDVVMPDTEYGYFPDGPVPHDLFEAGDPVGLAAAGGEDVAAFSLDAEGVDPIEIDLEVGGEVGADTVRMEDGADLELSWDGAEAGRRVRLQIKSNNQGHGLPVMALIDCEVDDTGSLIVPRAMVEAFPQKPYQNICVAIDCPPSSLRRFTRARIDVGDRTMELVAGFERQFIVVHE